MNEPTMNDRTLCPNLRTFAQGDLPRPLALLLFTQRLAALTEVNIGLTRVLDILAEMPPPYGGAAAHLKQEIQAGFSLCDTMSQQYRDENKATWWHSRSLFKAMSTLPDLFPPVYVALVRAAESAGTVDETLRRVQGGLAREWRLLADRPEDEQRMFLSRPGSMQWSHDWHLMSAYQQLTALALFFETFGMLLASGVAILPAMEVTAALLPTRQSAEFLEIHHEIRDGAPLLALPLERLDFIPRFAKEITGLGQMKGCLDEALHDVSLLFEQELEYRL